MDEPTAGELPKQYDHAQAQKLADGLWRHGRYFHAAPDGREKKFSIVIPPPNVTGALHLGHALNNTLQDILVRARRMQGFNTLWMPGTDHAGIATQAVVERRLLEEEKLSRHDLGREKLVERIWAWKEEYEARILGQLAQMGCSCDWDRTRFTLDETCARAVRHTFFGMFKAGLIYRGKRLVNWDTFLQTAVSDDEVFHETVAGNFWHIRYPIVDPQPGEPTHVVVATTRPETMLGDTAVAIHPDPAAALAAAEEQLRAKLAESSEKEKPAVQAQLDELAERRRTLLPTLQRLRDMARAGRRVLLPLLAREIPLVADEWAKPELGTGCVKITPAHDANDYEVGLRQKLPMVNILNPDGTLNAAAGPYRGLTIAAARKRVVADLESQNLLDSVEEREIELAHSDRSKTPIEPYLADQWFVRMQDLAQSAMDAVTEQQVKIFPPRYAKGYLDWLGEKRDWPVSRQLWWGHQIPVWYEPPGANQDARKKLHELAQQHPDKLAIGHYDSLLPPTDDGELVDLKWRVCINGGAPEIEQQITDLGCRRDPDVLDTWFSSALWPHSTLGWPEKTPELAYYYPTSTLVTNRDIITLWVARMVLAGRFNMGDVPFREVYIHPKILDGFGEGMSKSKGNGVDPLDIIDKFGADSLRFALAHMTTETQDVRMPVEFECPHCQTRIEQTKKNRILPRVNCPKCKKPFGTQWATRPDDLALRRAAVVNERFEVARNFCNKLWNAARFVLMNLEDYSPGPVDDADFALEDRWLLSRLATVTDEVTAALETYRFGDAARVLYDFSWSEFCSFYLEMAKARLQSTDRRAVVQRVLAHAFDGLLRLLHPIVPYITEQVWQLLGSRAASRGLRQPAPASESAMIAPWPQPDRARIDATIEASFARFQQVLSGLREIRNRRKLPQSIDFSVRCDAATAALLGPMTPYFASMAGARATAFGAGVTPPAAAASFIAEGMEVFVDLAGHIDIAGETDRGIKERSRLEQLIAAKQKQLANENFVARAPAEVLAKERAALSRLIEQLAALDESLRALQSSAGSP